MYEKLPASIKQEGLFVLWKYEMKDGQLSAVAEDIVNALDSYTEISPSGTGIRIVIKAEDFSYDVSKYYINNRSMD